MSENSRSLRGQCGCGAVAWTSSEPATNLDYCYCTQCQQVSDAPVVGWLNVPRRGLSLSGPVREFRLSHVTHRTCCSECGGTLTLEYDDYLEKPWVATATVIHTDWALPKLGSHMFLRSKPTWYAIAEDGARLCETFDEEFVRAWPNTVKSWKAGGMDEVNVKQ